MKQVLAIALILSQIQTFAQQTAQWRGNERSGHYSETGLLRQWAAEGPKLLWHFDDLGDGYSSAAVIGDKVFISGVEKNTGFVIAFDHEGKVIWKSSYASEWEKNYEGVRTSPMVNDGKLYIISSLGMLVCMDSNTGNIIWRVDVFEKYEGRNIKWGITENLLIDGDKLFCTTGGEKESVIALNKNTGELIWKCEGIGETSAYCSPMIIKPDNRQILVNMAAISIVGIDAANGKLLWKYDHHNKFDTQPNTPLYKDGLLYCVAGAGKGGVMLRLTDDGSNVEKVWENQSLDVKIGGVVLLDGRIYGSSDAEKNWVCLDWESGQELFTSTILKDGAIIEAEGLLYIYTVTGEMALVNPANDGLQLVSSFNVPFGSKQHWAHPVIHDGRLYLRHGNSLMVYGIRGG